MDKYIYNKGEQRIWLDEPKPILTDFSSLEFYNKDLNLWNNRKNYPVSEDVWADGQVVQEGKDFEIKYGHWDNEIWWVDPRVTAIPINQIKQA